MSGGEESLETKGKWRASWTHGALGIGGENVHWGRQGRAGEVWTQGMWRNRFLPFTVFDQCWCDNTKRCFVLPAVDSDSGNVSQL
jgi:hypothetical protein